MSASDSLVEPPLISHPCDSQPACPRSRVPAPSAGFLSPAPPPAPRFPVKPGGAPQGAFVQEREPAAAARGLRPLDPSPGPAQTPELSAGRDQRGQGRWPRAGTGGRWRHLLADGTSPALSGGCVGASPVPPVGRPWLCPLRGQPSAPLIRPFTQIRYLPSARSKRFRPRGAGDQITVSAAQGAAGEGGRAGAQARSPGGLWSESARDLNAEPSVTTTSIY